MLSSLINRLNDIFHLSYADSWSTGEIQILTVSVNVAHVLSTRTTFVRESHSDSESSSSGLDWDFSPQDVM